MQNVTVHTRAGRKGQGKEIVCPKCMTQRTVYHFWWGALVCGTCRAEVAKTDWLLPQVMNTKSFNVTRLTQDHDDHEGERCYCKYCSRVFWASQLGQGGIKARVYCKKCEAKESDQ